MKDPIVRPINVKDPFVRSSPRILLDIILFWEKKPNVEFHIKTVVFDLQIFTWLGIVLQG